MEAGAFESRELHERGFGDTPANKRQRNQRRDQSMNAMTDDGSDEVSKLFHSYVPEVADGTVQIKAIARNRGWRTTVSVVSKNNTVDPVYSCVGEKGNRIKSIVRDLANELVHVVDWSDSVSEHLRNLFKPATIERISLDQAKHEATIHASADQHPLILGKERRQIELIARLVGWKLRIAGD
ncbi:hypothetical protein GC207_15155 [bacterium]|nr:hypothetical protein [bacterium]